jgi:hypothetical protein
MQNLTELSVNEITKYRETLQNLKNIVNILLEDEIYFLKEMESLSNIDYNLLIKYDLLPKLWQKTNVKKKYNLNEQLLFQDIIKNIQKHYNNISSQIISSLDQIKSTYFQLNTKITSICSENFSSKLYGTQSFEHVLSFPISVQNNCFLHGIGYNSQLFVEIPNSDFTFKIVEVEKSYNHYNRSYETKSIFSFNPINSVKFMPEYPNTYFIIFNKIELEAGKSYEIFMHRKDIKNLNDVNNSNSNSKKSKYTIGSKSLSAPLFSFNSNNSSSYSDIFHFVKYLIHE